MVIPKYKSNTHDIISRLYLKANHVSPCSKFIKLKKEKEFWTTLLGLLMFFMNNNCTTYIPELKHILFFNSKLFTFWLKSIQGIVSIKHDKTNLSFYFNKILFKYFRGQYYIFNVIALVATIQTQINIGLQSYVMQNLLQHQQLLCPLQALSHREVLLAAHYMTLLMQYLLWQIYFNSRAWWVKWYLSLLQSNFV